MWMTGVMNSPRQLFPFTLFAFESSKIPVGIPLVFPDKDMIKSFMFSWKLLWGGRFTSGNRISKERQGALTLRRRNEIS